jgi:N6-L-threonylcarbamoyladenine synthase
MIVLGIETSCDDTSAAVYDGNVLKSNVISTQLVHRRFGGVVPELASRSHIRLIVPVIREALERAGIQQNEISGIAVTYGPGLAGSLLVGLSVAKGLSMALDIPMTGINHLEGHLWSNRISHPDLSPPFLVLIASGGHTELVHVKGWGKYRVIGQTRDDAAGEAFDKVGKLLDLGYPGGPAIEQQARNGDPAYQTFPRGMLRKGNLDFSFSGLKTAVLNHVKGLDAEKVSHHIADISASFQEAVVDVLARKTIAAAGKIGLRRICLAGGVAVNRALQKRIHEDAEKAGMTVTWPPPQLCTDNGGMIAVAGHYYLIRGEVAPLTLSPSPSLNL